MVSWIIGLSGSGKTTLGKAMYNIEKPVVSNTVFIDGDNIRSHFGSSGYTISGRKKNADFICKLCKWLDDQEINVICCVLSAVNKYRVWNRKNYSKYFEVFIDVPMEILKKRDKKNLYSGKIKNVVGIDIPFKPPKKPDYIFSNIVENIDFNKVAKSILSQARRKK